MKVVNPNDTNHLIVLIPRYYPLGTIKLSLFNESTSFEEYVANTYIVLNGVLSIDFDYTFKEGDRYQIKIEDGTNVLYRGLLLATTQETEDYIARNQYFY